MPLRSRAFTTTPRGEPQETEDAHPRVAVVEDRVDVDHEVDQCVLEGEIGTALDESPGGEPDQEQHGHEVQGLEDAGSVEEGPGRPQRGPATLFFTRWRQSRQTGE